MLTNSSKFEQKIFYLIFTFGEYLIILTNNIFAYSCCLYFFCVLYVQPATPQKRPRGTLVTLGETRKSWDDIDTRTQSKRIKVVLDVCETLKVPPSALAEPSPSPSPLGPAETYVELPRPCQRKVARRAGAKIASERQIRRMRQRDAEEKGLRVLVALRNDRGAIVLTEDQPEGDDVDFATVCADPIRLIQSHVAAMERLSDDVIDHSLARSLLFIGDYGQNMFSFGVQFLGDRAHSKDSFIPLYMHYGFDSVEKFKEFGQSVISALNSFDFTAAGYAVFLGGDMAWLNAAQGLMGTSSFFFVPSAQGGSITRLRAYGSLAL